jgi:hypothetical protein
MKLLIIEQNFRNKLNRYIGIHLIRILISKYKVMQKGGLEVEQHQPPVAKPISQEEVNL